MDLYVLFDVDSFDDHLKDIYDEYVFSWVYLSNDIYRGFNVSSL